MEQGRVNDAARVGQSTDLVVALLFLLCFCLSQLLLLWFSQFKSWISLFFVRLLWVPSSFRDFHITTSTYFSENYFSYMMSHNISSSIPPQCVLWL